MATSFNSLINRVELATIKLEDSVDIVQDAGQQIGDSLAQAAAYALDAETASVQAAINTGLSLQYANDAEDYRDEAQDIVQDFSQQNVIGEAPINGNQYARKDGSWALLEAGSGGGGTVVSVNGIEPNSLGDVTLNIPEQVNSDWEATDGVSAILNKPTLFDGDYSSLSNTPTIPENTSDLTNDSDFIADAPKDTNQYARKDGAWTLVEAMGGGGDEPFLTGASNDFKYGTNQFERWVDNNPYTQAQLTQLSVFIKGRTETGKQLFSDATKIEYVPNGAYYFKPADVTSTDLSGKTGVILKGNESTFAITDSGVFIFDKGNWVDVAGGGGEVSPFPVSTTKWYDGKPFKEWVSVNPNTPADLSKLEGVVMGRAKSGVELFTNTASIIDIPDGSYIFDLPAGSSTYGAMANHKGVIYVVGDYCWARATHKTTTDRYYSFTFKQSGSDSTMGTWHRDYVEPVAP